MKSRRNLNAKMTHKLYLTDLNDVGKSTFAKEANKKSSFILEQCPVNLCVQKQLDDFPPNLSASSSISCLNSDSSETEIFLFGGFELTASVKSVEIYVIPSGSATAAKQQENYITTCKGIPKRENGNENSTCYWYKFIFVQPGGAKPVSNVRLKFVGLHKTSESEKSCVIAIKELKLKGRLPGDLPKTSQTNQIPIPFATSSNNGDAMAAMMAQMRLNTMGQGVPMTTQFSQPTPTAHQNNNTREQQRNQEEQDKRQAEIISSVAGLGMFLRSSEERTISAVEKMISGMEDRIMERLDGLSARMDEMERNHKEMASIGLGDP